MECISYKKGYKYQLVEEYSVNITIYMDEDIHSKDKYVFLTHEGKLTMKKGYAWDGPSGPTIDTLNFMRGSLVHDTLYQLMREEELDRSKYREPADRLLQKICMEDGMTRIRAWWVYQGVHLGGDQATRPSNLKPVVKAPKACDSNHLLQADGDLCSKSPSAE